jgi:hypothetical protein
MAMKKIISVRKLIDIFSLGIIAGMLLLIYLYWPGRTSAASFDEFPVGQTRIVEFNADSDALDQMTAREKLDQMRDWLLYTAISSAGLSTENASQATFDLPTVRHTYLHPVARFDYGKTRSAYIGDGIVVALIPSGDPQTQNDNLAHIADEHRKNLGELPEQIVTLEYVINLDDVGDDHFAELTRRETIDAKKLFTEQAGYYEKKVTDLDGFKDFLNHVDMVTYAKEDSGLTLGGRKLQSEPYRKITAEDVAAIWQSEEKGGGKNHSSGFSLDPSYDFQGLKKYFDKELAPVLYFLLTDTKTLLPEISQSTNPPVFNPYTGSYRSQPYTASPVSPDEKIRKASAALAGTPPDSGPMLVLFNEVSQKNNELTRLFEARTKQNMSDLMRGIIQEINVQFRFQAARYDGQLQGTEVGMVLFYTDLLAKLWLSDRFHSTPSRQIDGFISQLEIQVSPLYKQDINEHSNTRLWFGKHDRAFQVADGGKTLLLDHIATRIYAAGSDSLLPDKESEANIVASTFLEWWDSHYEEVARYEPQYQRLNEIMRWSMIIGWLNDRGQSNTLGFLKSVNVYHGNWFPEWAKKQTDLRFKGWGKNCASGIKPFDTEEHDEVCFYPRKFKDCDTEALPLLLSRKYKRFGEAGSYYVGGVSLVGRGEVAARSALSAETRVGTLLRRANIDYSIARSSGNSLKTFEGVSYRFNSISAERSLVSVTAKDGVKMRGVAGEITGKPSLESTFTRNTSGLTVETQVGGTRAGSLNISRSGNGFRIGYTSREFDSAQVLARRMSLVENPESVLSANSRVEAYIKLPNEGGHYIKFKGADKWVKADRWVNTKVEKEIQGVGARIRDAKSNTHGYDISWVKAEDIPSKLRETIKVVGHDPVDPSIINALRRGQFKGAIDNIARDSIAARGQLAAHFEKGVQESSALLRNGNFDKALEHLDDLIAIHGPRPELKTLRALARLGKRSPEIGSHLGETLRAGREFNPATLIDEVNARLDASVRLVSDGRRVSLAYKTSSLSDVTRVTPEAVKGRAIIIVEDTPGLNNLDWQVNTMRSLEQAVELKVGELYQVSRLNIAELRPSRLIAPRPLAEAGQPVRNYRVLYPSSHRRDDCATSKDPDADCREKVYILSATGARR